MLGPLQKYQIMRKLHPGCVLANSNLKSHIAILNHEPYLYKHIQMAQRRWPSNSEVLFKTDNEETSKIVTVCEKATTCDFAFSKTYGVRLVQENEKHNFSAKILAEKLSDQAMPDLIFLVGTHILPYDLKTASCYGKSPFNKILGHTTFENYMKALQIVRLSYIKNEQALICIKALQNAASNGNLETQMEIIFTNKDVFLPGKYPPIYKAGMYINEDHFKTEIRSILPAFLKNILLTDKFLRLTNTPGFETNADLDKIVETGGAARIIEWGKTISWDL